MHEKKSRSWWLSYCVTSLGLTGLLEIDSSWLNKSIGLKEYVLIARITPASTRGGHERDDRGFHAFTLEPSRWGLRGDPWLWRDMRQRFAAVPCPATADELEAIVTAEFARLTVHPVTHGEMIHLEQYSHGGMSSGMVSPEFWRETAVPLLRQRHGEAGR